MRNLKSKRQTVAVYPDELIRLQEVERLARIVRKGAVDERCLFCEVRGFGDNEIHEDNCPWQLLDKALGIE